jgi:hypothetical protein
MSAILILLATEAGPRPQDGSSRQAGKAQFEKGSLLRKSDSGSGQADAGIETRRRSLFIASKTVFRYYFLIRANQDH